MFRAHVRFSPARSLSTIAPVDLLFGRHLGEARKCRHRKTFVLAEAKEAPRAQALRELVEDLLLQRATEVDEDVAAEDHLHLAEGVIGDEIVGKEEDVPLQRLAYRHLLV